MATNSPHSQSVQFSDVAFVAFDCPRCQEAVTRLQGSVQCPDCGFAPAHGAD